MPQLVAIVEVIGIGGVKVDGPFHKLQAQGLGIKIKINLCAASDCGDVVNADDSKMIDHRDEGDIIRNLKELGFHSLELLRLSSIIAPSAYLSINCKRKHTVFVLTNFGNKYKSLLPGRIVSKKETAYQKPTPGIPSSVH